MKLNLKAGSIRSELSPRALEKWNPAIKAAVENTSDTITIYGVIGEDFWTGEGVTVKRIDAALRTIGDKAVTVYINSPGGDMFEGIAIYNRLREHSQQVTTKVLGLAASAASVIYLAGEERQVASSAFLMIHNCWTWLAGNRHYLRDVADDLEEFDAAMADLYAETSGQPVEDMAELMDDETFIRGKRALELGLATGLLTADEVVERDDDGSKQASALKAMDVALAKAGVPRSQRRELFSQFKPSTPSAAGGTTPSAGPTDTPRAVAPDLSASLSAASNILSQIGGNHAH
jgi:ATP-dependent protease ClpP protease subunit